MTPCVQEMQEEPDVLDGATGFAVVELTGAVVVEATGAVDVGGAATDPPKVGMIVERDVVATVGANDTTANGDLDAVAGLTADGP